MMQDEIHIAEYPPSGLSVVVVGAGFGGLTTAIECKRKGHDVVVLERAPKWSQLGDIISLSPNAGQVISRWSRSHVTSKLESLCMNHQHFRIHQHDGEHVLDQPRYPPSKEKPMFNGHRSDIHRVFREYAAELDIPIHLGKQVAEYGEADGKAWVVTEEGEMFKGDIVVAADGVRSRARRLVLGYEEVPEDSGYAIYRAWFDAKAAGIDTDPLTREFVMNGDTHTGWLGNDIHLLLATCKGGKEVSWVMTHKATKNSKESWSTPGKIEEVLELLEGWDPRARRVIERTPACIDWKLVRRSPLPTWISANQHICLLGDAAHPFLPTSIQGCSQAIEDGCVLATTLALSAALHKSSAATTTTTSPVPRALTTWQRLRQTRVSKAQLVGERVREMWHTVDWSKVRTNPDLVKLPREPWLVGHDCEKHTLDTWADVLAEIAGGWRLTEAQLAAASDAEEERGVARPLTPQPTPTQELLRRLE